MKKFLSLFVVLVGFAVFAEAIVAQAAVGALPASAAYYDAGGTRVYGDDLYQANEGWLYFGRNCYYFDQYGNQVSANGRRAFYYDIYGNFLAGRQMYQYPQDYAYGTFLAGTPVYYYYDVYGNLIGISRYDFRYGAYGSYMYDYYWLSIPQ
jgi:hypothetical protein